MLPLLIAFLWFLVKLVVIWGSAYIIKVVVDWVPFLPVPIKTIVWYIVVIVAIILSVIALIDLVQMAPLVGLR